MFWSKKDKKDILPDLPPTKSSIPERMPIPEEEHDFNEEKQGLPSFPDSPIKKGFSQSAIKDAVKGPDAEENEIPISPIDEKKIKIVEIEEDNLELSEPPKSINPKSFKEEPASLQATYQKNPYPESKSSDIFIKIDKFHSAKRALVSAQEQIEKIDSVLRKIRETKMREEQELSSWEKEIVQAKSNIQEITKNIFDKT